MNDLLNLLPPHKGGLFLEHNVHKNYYDSAKEAIKQQEEQEVYSWKDEESKQRAIDTDEIWTLQWYPDTPVGFQAIAAPTLHELLEMANSGEFN